MSLPSQFVASGPIPSATFSGWDSQTEQLALFASATTSGGAAGPADAIQFSDGAGNFQGTANATVSSAGGLACQTLATVGLCAVGGNITIAGNQNTLGQATIGATGNGALFCGNANVSGTLSQLTTSTIPVAGSGTLSGTWKSVVQNVAGMTRTTWTLLNSPFVANSVLNIPINGSAASRVRLICVNDGNTQSRSIMGEWSISPASGVFTQGTGYYVNFNMSANWANSGTATPLVLSVQLSGGGGGLVGTISIIAEQDAVTA